MTPLPPSTDPVRGTRPPFGTSTVGLSLAESNATDALLEHVAAILIERARPMLEDLCG